MTIAAPISHTALYFVALVYIDGGEFHSLLSTQREKLHKWSSKINLQLHLEQVIFVLQEGHFLHWSVFGMQFSGIGKMEK